MEIKIHASIFLFLLFIVFPCIFNTHSNNKLQSNTLDLSGELDKKLGELFTYYNDIGTKKNEVGEKGVITLITPKENSIDNKEIELIRPGYINTKKIEITHQAEKVENKNIIEKIGKNVVTINQNTTKLNETISLESKINSPREISFIQSSIKEDNVDDTSEIFSYQPFVWTELSIPPNSIGPSARRGHSALIADTYMIIFGGCYMETKCFNDLFFIDLRTQKWIAVPSKGEIPSPRQGHSAVLYGSVMWIYGGSSGDGYLNDLYSLNLETKEWKKHYFTSSKSAGRAGHGAVLDDNMKMIIFGGYSESGYSNEIFVINLNEERFEAPLSTGKPPSPRENFSMIRINGRIYIFGGFQEGGVLNDTYSIDLLTWTWTEVKVQGPTPPARQGMASTRVGKKIYLTGGCDYRSEICYTDTYILDVDALWWTKVENNKSDLTGRNDFSIVFFRGHLYTFGGCEMFKQCFKNIFIMNINDLCPVSCSNKGECKDLIGCTCNSGYSAHDCSEKVKCKDDCSEHGVCHNNAKCGCFPGWSGIVCNTLLPCPKNCTEVTQGVCQSDSSCKCKTGFEGNDCSQFIMIGNDTDSNSDPFKALTEIGARKIAQFSNKTRMNNVTAMKRQEEEEDKPKEEETKTVIANATTSEIIVATPKNKTNKSATEKEKLEIENLKMYKLGFDNNEIYYQTKDCENSCNKKGLCLNSTCFCEQGSTNTDCSRTYKQYLTRNIKFADVMIFLVVAFAVAFVGTLIIMAYRKTAKVTSDHLEL